jgi:hypothetical protein
MFEEVGWSYSDATKVVMVGYGQVAAASGGYFHLIGYNVAMYR